jgi:virginiamycin B lyase
MDASELSRGGAMSATSRAALVAASFFPLLAQGFEVKYFDVPHGSAPHDVAAAPDGTVWYTAQGKGELGRLDPRTGQVERIALGRDSAPHGVIVGPDGAAWVTDGGQNAIVRVDPATKAVKLFPLPAGTPYANLNTAAFDGHGTLWYTGQSGYYGRVDPKTGEVRVWEAPGGPGTYGITATPSGDIYYASLAGNHIARVDTASGKARVIEPPTKDQGARRVWSDSKGRIWVSEWSAGQVAMYDPASGAWREWRAPGANAHVYAVWVDESDGVWISEWGTSALLRFDPATQKFEPATKEGGYRAVRQILGRRGETWGAESGADRLVRVTR